MSVVVCLCSAPGPCTASENKYLIYSGTAAGGTCGRTCPKACASGQTSCWCCQDMWPIVDGAAGWVGYLAKVTFSLQPATTVSSDTMMVHVDWGMTADSRTQTGSSANGDAGSAPAGICFDCSRKLLGACRDVEMFLCQLCLHVHHADCLFCRHHLLNLRIAVCFVCLFCFGSRGCCGEHHSCPNLHAIGFNLYVHSQHVSCRPCLRLHATTVLFSCVCMLLYKPSGCHRQLVLADETPTCALLCRAVPCYAMLCRVNMLNTTSTGNNGFIIRLPPGVTPTSTIVSAAGTPTGEITFGTAITGNHHTAHSYQCACVCGLVLSVTASCVTTGSVTGWTLNCSVVSNLLATSVW